MSTKKLAFIKKEGKLLYCSKLFVAAVENHNVLDQFK